MQPVAIEITSQSGRVVDQLYIADNFWLRLRGLIARPDLKKGSAFWIRPCQQVHMFFMRQIIDAVFLNKEMVVVRKYEKLKPWQWTAWVREAHSVLELPAGSASAIQVGERLKFNKHQK